MSGRPAVLVNRHSARSDRSCEGTVAIDGTHQRMLFVHLHCHHDLPDFYDMTLLSIPNSTCLVSRLSSTNEPHIMSDRLFILTNAPLFI